MLGCLVITLFGQSFVSPLVNGSGYHFFAGVPLASVHLALRAPTSFVLEDDMFDFPLSWQSSSASQPGLQLPFQLTWVARSC